MACTYVKLSVYNYTNVQVPSTYTLENTPLTFIAELSSFSNVYSDRKGLWDFGDGTVTSELSTTHQFKWPGIYDVTFSVFTSAGNAVLACDSFQVSAYNYVGNFLKVNYPTTEQIAYYKSGRPTDDLIINRFNSWHSYPSVSAEGYTLTFYSSGSNSDYLDYDVYSKDPWAHLQSYFFFIKKQNNRYEILSSAKTSSDPIYATVINNQIVETSYPMQGSVLAGTSGVLIINYIDQKPKNLISEPPVILFFNFDNTKFPTKNNILLNTPKNIKDLATENYYPVELPLKIRYNPATKINFSSNGVDGEGFEDQSFKINKIKWQNYPVYFFAKLKDDLNYSTKQYPNLTFNNTNNFYDLNCQLINVSTNEIIPNVTFYKNSAVKKTTRSGGYYSGYFVSDYAVENVALSGYVTIYDNPYYDRDIPYAWLGQGLDSYSYYFSSSAEIASNLFRFAKSRLYSACGNTLAVSFSSSNNSPTAFSGLLKNPFAIAVSYIDDDAVWLADADRDRILKITTNGDIIFDIDLGNAPLSSNGSISYVNLKGPLSGATPSSIALDRQGNAWVTLYTAGSCLKLDRYTGTVIAAAYPNYPDVDFYLLHSLTGTPITTVSGIPIEIFMSYNFPPLSGMYANETTMTPSCVDTDLDNNIWVTYSNPLKGYIIKYDTNGQFLTSKEFPTLYSPQQLLIERNNKVYVTVMTYLKNTSGLFDRNDFIFKYDSTTTQIESGFPLSGYSGLGGMTVDNNQYIYALYNREQLIRLKNSDDITIFYGGSGNNLSIEYQSIDALGVDTENVLWIVNNFDQAIYLYQVETPFSVTPIADVGRISTQNINPLNLKAYGDWTGMRWMNKYYFNTYNTQIRTVSGISEPFNIYPLSGKYGFAKINEDFDASETFKSFALQESLINSPLFFNSFLGQIVGNKNSYYNTIGKRIYEKISNFVSNNSDVDICELSQLKGMESLLGYKLQDYNLPFPSDLQRLVNLLSIKPSVLKSQSNQFQYNYDKKSTISNSSYGRNLGNEIEIENCILPTSGIVVLYEKFGEVYSEGKLTNPGVIKNSFLSAGTQVVRLSDVNMSWGWPLVLAPGVSGIEIKRYYTIYEYIPGSDLINYDSIINWDDSFTTITKNQSSYNEWFGDDQIVDNIINYQLSLGLGLLSGNN